MSPQAPGETPPKKRIIFRLVRAAGLTLLILFLLMFLLGALGVGSGQVELGFTLAFGWVYFLKRTLAQIVWNWSLVGMAGVSAILVLFLAHWFFGWLTKIRSASFRWPVRWTVSGLVGIGLLFLVGMAIGGIVHQVGWMAASDQPLFELKGRRFYEFNNMRQLELAVYMASEDAQGNLEKMRQVFWKTPNEYFNQSKDFASFMQAYHVLIVTKADGTIEGSIIFPRNIASQKTTGGLLRIGNQDRDSIPAAKLGDVLEKYKGRLQAF